MRGAESLSPRIRQRRRLAGPLRRQRERLNRLFAAGGETFRQNALDIFMDCPSRERAGWLCDSFFTARVAKDLCGDTRSRRISSRTSSLPPKFAFLPDGMLPMCYPADHNDGVFIPNWACGSSSNWRNTSPAAATARWWTRSGPASCGCSIIQEVRKSGRPAGEAGGLGVRRMVRRQLIRAGCELSLATCSTPRRSTPRGKCMASPN